MIADVLFAGWVSLAVNDCDGDVREEPKKGRKDNIQGKHEGML